MKPGLQRPGAAIAWEIWTRHRFKLGAALGSLLVFRILIFLAPHLGFSLETFQTLAYLVTVAAMFCIFASFHFTEGNRKGGFGGFPKRCFVMPLKTSHLVLYPSIYGTITVVVMYLLSVLLALRPVGVHPPVIWPLLYLVCGLALFQSTLWTFPERRYLKLILLSFFATILCIAWMFFLPHMLVGTLEQLGYQGHPDRFRMGLSVFLLAMLVLGYAMSMISVHAQRTGSKRILSSLLGSRNPFALALPHRRKPFKNKSAAMFWMEWRHAGLVLPISVATIMLITFVPTYLTRPHTASETIATLIWFFLTPLSMALIIGRGTCKPDFWKSELAPPTFQSMKPVAPGEWILIKMKVAGLSVIVSWSVVLYTAILWMGHAGNLAALEPIWATFKGYQRSPLERVVFCVLGSITLLIVTWRFQIGSLWSGMSGSKPWYIASNTVFVLMLLSIILLVIRQTGGNASSGWQLHDLWPLFMNAPIPLTLLVIFKSLAAAYTWGRVGRASILSCAHMHRYLCCWLLGTAVVMVFCWVAVAPGVFWLQYLLSLVALLIFPLWKPALAMIHYQHNRFR